MRKEIDTFLNHCVRQSLIKSTYPAIDDFSVLDCIDNQYLHSDYDPFKMLEFDLMAFTIREKYGFNELPE